MAGRFAGRRPVGIGLIDEIATKCIVCLFCQCYDRGRLRMSARATWKRVGHDTKRAGRPLPINSNGYCEAQELRRAAIV